MSREIKNTAATAAGATAAPARLHRDCTVQLQCNSVQLAKFWGNCVKTSIFLCNSTWAKRVLRDSMRSVHSAGSVRLPFRSASRVSCVCVRLYSRGVRASPPPWVGVACALRAVLVQGAGRAVPGSSCASAFPAPVPCSAYLALGGVVGSLRPLAWLRVPGRPAGGLILAIWLCALCRRHEDAWGGGGGPPLSWEWGVRGWALSHAPPPVLGACGRGPVPTGCGCGGCGRGDPSSTPRGRALASWLCALWGRHDGARGAPLAWVWGVWGWAFSKSLAPVFGACSRGRLPAGCGCGGGARGDPSPTPQRALLQAGFARCGGDARAPKEGRLLPGGGASGAGRSPTPNRPSLPRTAGARYTLAVGAGDLDVGTRHQPHSARSFELTMRTVGAARGRLAGGASCLGMGRPELGALPCPTARPCRVRPGPATHWLLVRGVWRGDPS